MPDAPYGEPINWLTVALVDPEIEPDRTREGLRLVLEDHDIEARPAWKPLHLQPLFADHEMIGGAVAEHIFDQGLCLPERQLAARRRPSIASIETAPRRAAAPDDARRASRCRRPLQVSSWRRRNDAG